MCHIKTFMGCAKSREGTSAGLIGITTNYHAGLPTLGVMMTTSQRVKYVQAAFDLADMCPCSGTAGQTMNCVLVRFSEIYESAVKGAMVAVESLANTFSVDPTKLVVLS